MGRRIQRFHQLEEAVTAPMGTAGLTLKFTENTGGLAIYSLLLPAAPAAMC